MRLLVAASVLTVAGCAMTPPRPTLWQIESECASGGPIGQIEICTRRGMQANYGDAWHGSAPVETFLAFIGSIAQHVASGQMNEADGRFAIAQYAGDVQSQAAAAQQAVAAENMAAGMQALQSAGPCTVRTPAFVPCPAGASPGATSDAYGGGGVTAFLVSTRSAASVTGQMIMACTYQYGTTRFERYFPAGSMCPMTVQAQ